MNKETIVEMKNVSFAYNFSPVLEEVNLIIQKNDFLGIIGPNGGGKTTLLKILLGLLPPRTGEVLVFGKPPKASRKYVSYVPQIFSYDFDFPISVLDVALMGRLNRQKIGKYYSIEDKTASLDALAKVGMEQFQDTAIGDLSGGQRQRVFIAHALASKPKLLLLDEPVASIDPQWQLAFFTLLDELNKNISIVLVTHDVSVISTYIDQIACVNRTIHFHGKTKDGIHQISQMYHCPVDLVAHSIPHRSLKGHELKMGA
jgi:zinc transport system ATP-binding protein